MIDLRRFAGLRAVARPIPRTLAVRKKSNTVTSDVVGISSTLVARLQSKAPLSAIHNYYPALVAELQKTATTSKSSPPPSLTRDHLITVLDVLATSGRPEDLQRIEEILLHMPTMFGVQLSVDIHSAILRGLIKKGNPQTIYRWLFNMPLRPTPFTPTLDQFHTFLAACLELASYKYVRHVIRTMSSTGCKPTTETFKYLIRARWEAASQEDKILPPGIFSTFLDEMQGLPYDASLEELLYTSYADRKSNKWATMIRDEYRSRFAGQILQHQVEEWKKELSDVAQSKGVQGAVEHYFQVLETKGCKQSPRILRGILWHSKSIDDVRMVCERFNVPLAIGYFSILVKNNVRAGNVAGALSAYEESKAAGIVPDAGLVDPLINALCSPVPSEEFLDKALAIYRDLIAVATPSSEPKPDRYVPSPGPDTAIYHSLLRGCATSPHIDKYFPIAKDLLDDMEIYNVIKSDSITASSIIVLFMRRAQNIADALDVYYGLRSCLDEKGYAIVLNAFCKLSFNNELPLPPLVRYFDIVKDMRRAGLEITVEVYTILLKQLAIVPTQYSALLTQDHINELVTTTRRVHDFLTLDAAVSPDELVWNQLMDTYQRLGCFADAYRLWDTMYLTGRFNHVSVSIILDACGYAGAWEAAKKICTQLFRDRFSFDLHNWNTWIECLCRLNRLNDALRVVCLEMGKNGNTVAPDVESARILIKFARRDNMDAEVLERLQRYLPELWETLPEDLRVPIHQGGR
ncbi:hypothetical protein C0991_007079 [Blastosporella zonata]|nr:hypothetical protein C0991_007079 [Blastosporella zonata]